jgi:hypothetical protein
MHYEEEQALKLFVTPSHVKSQFFAQVDLAHKPVDVFVNKEVLKSIVFAQDAVAFPKFCLLTQFELSPSD